MLVQKVVAVKRLQEMGLISLFTNKPEVVVYPQILRINDAEFMKNWCMNIRDVWIAHNPLADDREVEQLELKVYNKISGDLICRFNNRLIMHS